ncbi:MAG TPA: hypothetical protein VJP86_09815, partial [Vicinamibacterales bacterium]|nr:hypothetical protein [Vicinamibacterales bacterium]
MRRPTTTRCCSALALALAVSTVGGEAQTPSSIFPAQVIWTKSVDTSLAAPPAFDRDSVYLPLATNRLERRDLVAGEPIWVVDAEAKSRPAAA